MTTETATPASHPIHICYGNPLIYGPPLLNEPKCFCRSKHGRTMEFNKLLPKEYPEQIDRYYDTENGMWVCPNCSSEKTWNEGAETADNMARQGRYEFSLLLACLDEGWEPFNSSWNGMVL